MLIGGIIILGLDGDALGRSADDDSHLLVAFAAVSCHQG